jgi:hypothetical protein
VLPAQTFSVKLPAVTNRHLVASRQAMQYQPLPLVHPTTGQALNPKAMVTLPDADGRRGKGKQMTVSEFFAALNQTEKSLTEWGYSLRTLPPPATARTPVRASRMTLAQARKASTPSGLQYAYVHDTSPLGAYLGIKRKDYPEFPMEWAWSPSRT